MLSVLFLEKSREVISNDTGQTETRVQAEGYTGHSKQARIGQPCHNIAIQTESNLKGREGNQRDASPDSG